MEKSFSVAVRVLPAAPEAPAEPDAAAEEAPPDVLPAAAELVSFELPPQAVSPSARMPAPSPAASRETGKVRTGPPGVGTASPPVTESRPLRFTAPARRPRRRWPGGSAAR